MVQEASRSELYAAVEKRFRYKFKNCICLYCDLPTEEPKGR